MSYNAEDAQVDIADTLKELIEEEMRVGNAEKTEAILRDSDEFWVLLIQALQDTYRGVYYMGMMCKIMDILKANWDNDGTLEKKAINMAQFPIDPSI